MTAEDGSTNTEYEFKIKTLFKNDPPGLKTELALQTVEANKTTEWSLPEIVDPEKDDIESIELQP